VRVYWLRLKTKVYGLSVVWPRNHRVSFLLFGLKTDGDRFLCFGLKTGGSGFPVWTLKLAATVWCFGPQIHRVSFSV
jgi:hypothetical protein